MLKLTAVITVFVLALIWNADDAHAEFCIDIDHVNRFYLQITAKTTTSRGTVMSLVGLRDSTNLSPVTGTLFVEPDSVPIQARVTLANTTSNDVNLIYNIHLGAISDSLGTVFAGPYSVFQQGDPFPLPSSTASLVDCQTGALIRF